MIYNARWLTCLGLLLAVNWENVPCTEAAPPTNQPDTDSAFLHDVEMRTRMVQQQARANVQNAITQARGMMGVDAAEAEALLKLQWQMVQQTPELSADVRRQLLDELERGLRSALSQAVVQAQRSIEQQDIEARRLANEELLRDLTSRQAKIKQISERMQALLEEGRYRDAEMAAQAAEALDVQSPALAGAVLAVRTMGNQSSAMAIRDARHQRMVDTLRTAEVSHIPTPDDPPIRYPSPETWRLLTEKRAKYRSVDLTQVGPTEAKIIKALDDVTELEFVETPLADVIDFLKARHAIEIQLDHKALTDANVALDTPVTKNLKGISLRSALRLLLRDLDLKYVIQDEVLMISTKDVADDLTKPKVYPVADLVIPIRNSGISGFGGLGGGMGGGGGGGYGGGGGGGFGGGGGLGGGGGGFGGGGGGLGGGF